MMQRLGKAGFTLVEAMIIGSMLMVVIVTFSSWSYQQARINKMREERRNHERVANSIKSIATQSESLTATEELMFDPTLPTPSPSPTP